MSNLFQSLKPELQRNKHLLVSGYVKQHCLITEIGQLCLLFYDEVINWTINKNMLNNIKVDSNIFYCNKIKFKCSLDPDVTFKNEKGYAIVYLRAWLTSNIKSIKFYFTMYCKQKDALFQRVVKLVNKKQSDNWVSEDFWLVIHCKNYDKIYLNHYIDLLQIQYDKT
eukprot:554186_1